jgi:hypothetical protein
MSETVLHTPRGYLHNTLTEGLKMATTFLDSIHTNTHAYATTPPTLIAAPKERTEDILKTYYSGASEGAYKVSLPPSTLAF